VYAREIYASKGYCWGGILVGFKNSDFKIISWQYFEYCTVAVVKNQVDKFTWRLVAVYGAPEAPYEETKLDIVKELHIVMGM
jgi:hypothetical protein